MSKKIRREIRTYKLLSFSVQDHAFVSEQGFVSLRRSDMLVYCYNLAVN